MSDNYADTYDAPCTVCHGRGVLLVEDAQPLVRCTSCGVKNRSRPGHQTRCGKCHQALPFTPASFTPPVGEKPCPYCRGAKTSMWAQDRLQADLNKPVSKWWLLCPTIYLILWIHRERRMSPRLQARRRFTTQDEADTVRMASYGLAGAAWLKESVNNHHHQAAAAQQQASGSWTPYQPQQQFYSPSQPHQAGATHQAQANYWNYQYNPSHHHQPPQSAHGSPHNPYADQWNDTYNPSHHHPGQ